MNTSGLLSEPQAAAPEVPTIGEQLLSLPFDCFGRYAFTREITSHLWPKEQPRLRFLDVGGHSSSLKHFLPEHEVILTDIQPPPDFTHVESIKFLHDGYLLSIGQNLPFAPCTFDLVTAHDTLEHVPVESRPAFLQELLRVSRGFVLINGPIFDSKVVSTEEQVYDFFTRVLSWNHPYLREHIELGLPRAQMIESVLKDDGARFVRVPNGKLAWWLATMAVKYYIGAFPNSSRAQEALDRAYNAVIAPGDFGGLCYRQAYVISKDGQDEACLRRVEQALAGPHAADAGLPSSAAGLAVAEDLISALADHASSTLGWHEETAKSLEGARYDLRVAIQQQDNLQAEKDAVLAEKQALREEPSRLRRELQVRQGELEGVLRRLSDIENSVGWRLLNRLRPVLRRVAPHGSLRLRALLALGRMGLSVASGRALGRPLALVASPLRVLRRVTGVVPNTDGRPRVRRLRVGCYAEHGWSVGGGIAYTLQLLIPLTAYYDVEVLLPPGAPLRDQEWYSQNLLLDTGAIKVRHYASGIENTYDVWLSVWNERIWPARTPKRFNVVWFPFVKLDGTVCTQITISRYSAGYLKDRYNTDEIIIIPPSVSVDEYEIGPKEPMILHVSRFSMPSAYADKAHITMIQAFRQLWEQGLRGWRLVLAGATLDEGESTYAAHLAKHAHGFPVEFALNLPAAELRKLFARASIYWHATGFSVKQPAAQEHFGITILEGMAAGAVPVVYNSGGPPEIITNGETGYLFDTLDELCEKTWNVTTNPRLWRRLSTAARQRARYFSPERVKSLMLSTVSQTEKASIIIGTHDNLEVLKRAVQSILENTPPGYELIIVDNGSSDGTWVYLASLDYPHLRVIRNKSNQGFAAFNNRGQRVATRPYILYLNDDIEAFAGWLEPLIEILDSQPKVGAVGSRLLYPDGRVQHDGKMFRKSDLEPRHVNMGGRPVHHESPIEVDALTGACLMVRRELAGFSTDYRRGYYEDTDLCMRIKEIGYALVLHRGSVLIHHHGLSMGKDQAATERAQKRNRELFMRRWASKLPSLVYLASDSEIAGKEVRCRPIFQPGELESWPLSQRLEA